MKHKCDGCRYKSEHQEMGFRPFGVCIKSSNLIEAEKAFNAEKCPYKEVETGLKDNEIIKAYEACQKGHCDEDCPFYGFAFNYGSNFDCTIEFINFTHRLQAENQSQKAKIEALQMDCQQLQNDIVNANMNVDHTLAENERLKAEIERLRSMNQEKLDMMHELQTEIGVEIAKLEQEEIKQVKIIKVEAVKEFVENLLKISKTIDPKEVNELLIIRRDDFDTLVKEMESDFK